jgi:hypothetical protein
VTAANELMKAIWSILQQHPVTWVGKRQWFICLAHGCGQRVVVIYGGGIFACREHH